MLLIRILCLLYYSLGHLISMSLYIIVNIAVIFMVMYDHNKLLFFVLHITQCVKKLFNGNPLCKSKLLIFYARNKYFKLNLFLLVLVTKEWRMLVGWIFLRKKKLSMLVTSTWAYPNKKVFFNLTLNLKIALLFTIIRRSLSINTLLKWHSDAS